LAGSTGVLVLVDGMDVLVGIDVPVGGMDVAVGGMDVAVGAMDVLVGGMDVSVGATDVSVGGIGVGVKPANTGVTRQSMATNTNIIQTPIALAAIRLGVTDNPPLYCPDVLQLSISNGFSRWLRKSSDTWVADKRSFARWYRAPVTNTRIVR
jgi:hypothetical protein